MAPAKKKYPRRFIDETQTGEDGYPEYRRRNTGEVVIRDSAGHITNTIDNQWVVPYNPLLSKLFKADLNVKFCNSVKAIKYINKGSDAATFGIVTEAQNDEIQEFRMGRYISTNEAFWHMFGFPIHERSPTITHLQVHLENGQRVYFTAATVTVEPRETTLTAFFKLCEQDNFAKTLLYCEVPHYYTWNNKSLKRRVQGERVEGHPAVRRSDALGRVYGVHPNNRECFYLRLLLHQVKGPTSFEFLKTVDGIQYPLFGDACDRLGLLKSDQHWIATLHEASVSSMPAQLRTLFAILLQFCMVSEPEELWERFKGDFSEDTICEGKRRTCILTLTIMFTTVHSS